MPPEVPDPRASHHARSLATAEARHGGDGEPCVEHVGDGVVADAEGAWHEQADKWRTRWPRWRGARTDTGRRRYRSSTGKSREPILSQNDMSASRERLTEEDFRRLLEFRDGLRRFLRWGEDRARSVGLTSAQHQLLLAVRGHGSPPSIGDLASHLLLRHHSAVELVDRTVTAGLVERIPDPEDHRVVRLRLTKTGRYRLDALSAAHLEELSRLRARFESLWDRLPEPLP